MKSIANYISISRIILAPILLIINPQSSLFIVLYLLCGVSDVADGYIARRTNTESSIGAKIDTIADIVMFGVILVLLYPILISNSKVIIFITIILLIRVISLGIVFIRYKTIGIVHTIGNKLTGIALYGAPLLMSSKKVDIILYLICTIALLASIDELLINIYSKELDLNKSSYIDMKTSMGVKKK